MPRRRRSFLATNRSKVAAGLFGLAAALGLLLAGTPLLSRHTTPPAHTSSPVVQTTPQHDPDRSTPTPSPSETSQSDFDTLLDLTDTALATPGPSAPQTPLTSLTVPPLSPPAVPVKPLNALNSPKWVTNASLLPRTPPSPQNPQLAIVIDDMGEDFIQSKQTLEILPATITYAFLPYPAATPKLARQARAQGHELLIHLPMQPKGELKQQLSPQNTMLLTADDSATLVTKIQNDIKGLSDISIGVNNHMGSAFTQDPEGMKILLKQLDDNQMMFLDSLTIAPTATRKAAAGLTLPLLTRNVFLDDVQEEDQIEHELNRAIAYAKQHGSAIAIGHPHKATLAVLQKKMNDIKEQGVTLVPLTHLLPPAQY